MKTKTILIGIFVMLGCYVQAQDSTKVDTPIVLTRIIELPGMSKGQIYDRAVLWSVDAFKKTKGAMQVGDKEAGVLAFDAAIDAAAQYPEGKGGYMKFYSSTFKIKVQSKDGKMRVIFSDFTIISPDFKTPYPLSSSVTPPVAPMFTSLKKYKLEWTFFKEKIVERASKILDDMVEFMNKKDDF